MIGGIGLVMISLHIRDIGELGRGQQLQIETPKRTGPTAQAPKLFGGAIGEEMDVGGPGCAPGLPSDHPGDALIEAIIGGIPQKMQNR